MFSPLAGKSAVGCPFDPKRRGSEDCPVSGETSTNGRSPVAIDGSRVDPRGVGFGF